jgi:hypothetical protein
MPKIVHLFRRAWLCCALSCGARRNADIEYAESPTQKSILLQGVLQFFKEVMQL